MLLRIAYRAMSSHSWLRPPGPCASVDLRRLLRENFTHRIELPAVRVPRQVTRRAAKALRPLALRLPVRIESEAEETDDKLIFLDPEKVDLHSELLSPKAKTQLHALSVAPHASESVPVTLTYEHLRLEHVLEIVLPPQLKVTAYTLIGHIAHLNLKYEALPFKFLIGQAIIDKVKIVKTVVNKTDQIDNTYRNFQLELLAGEENFITTQSANGCSFQMDFSKVYWNSRLSTEHRRLAEQLSPGDVLYDAFAGVGPFAVPAGRMGCRVLANDLNPESFRWLQLNVRQNHSKRRPLAISCSNLDAKEFLQRVVAADYRWEARCQGNEGPRHRLFLVMNLPALAVTFLGSLRHLVSPRFVQQLEGGWDALPDVNVRCYCFLRNPTNENSTLSEAANEDSTLSEAANENSTLSEAANESSTLSEAANESSTLSEAANEDSTLSEAANEDSTVKELTLTQANVTAVLEQKLRIRRLEGLAVHFVRNVATRKNMYRLDFKITGAMLREMAGVRQGEEPSAKRARCGDE